MINLLRFTFVTLVSLATRQGVRLFPSWVWIVVFGTTPFPVISVRIFLEIIWRFRFRHGRLLSLMPKDTAPVSDRSLFLSIQYFSPICECIHNTRCHRRGHSQRSVSSHEVIMPKMQRKRGLQAFQLFAESVGQASKPPHCHPQRQVLSFDVRSGNITRVRITHHSRSLYPCYCSWRIRFMPVVAVSTPVNFGQLSVVDSTTKSPVNSPYITIKSVGGQLDSTGDPLSQFVHEPVSIVTVTLADHVAGDKFCFRVHCDENKLVAFLTVPLKRGELFLFSVDKSPDFVGFNSFHGNVLQPLVEDLLTACPDTAYQADNRISVYAGDPLGTPDAVTLDQQTQNHLLFLSFQPIHGLFLLTFSGKGRYFQWHGYAASSAWSVLAPLGVCPTRRGVKSGAPARTRTGSHRLSRSALNPIELQGPLKDQGLHGPNPCKPLYFQEVTNGGERFCVLSMRAFLHWDAFMLLERRDYSWSGARRSFYKFNAPCLSIFCSTVCHLPYSGESNNSSLYRPRANLTCASVQLSEVPTREYISLGVDGASVFDKSRCIAFANKCSLVFSRWPLFLALERVTSPFLSDWINACSSRIFSSASWIAIRFCSSFIAPPLFHITILYTAYRLKKQSKKCYSSEINRTILLDNKIQRNKMTWRSFYKALSGRGM